MELLALQIELMVEWRWKTANLGRVLLDHIAL